MSWDSFAGTPMNERSRCRLICLISTLGAFAGMALSWRVWVAPTRDFAALPIAPWLDLTTEATTGLPPVLLFGICPIPPDAWLMSRLDLKRDDELESKEN